MRQPDFGWKLFVLLYYKLWGDPMCPSFGEVLDLTCFTIISGTYFVHSSHCMAWTIITGAYFVHSSPSMACPCQIQYIPPEVSSSRRVYV